MRHAVSTVLLSVLVSSASLPAEANSLVRQLARTGLSQEDVNIMVRAGGELYANGQAAAGADTIWSNPATGAYGSVEVASVEGACVDLTYRFRTTRHSRVQTVATRRCLTDGRWTLTP